MTKDELILLIKASASPFLIWLFKPLITKLYERWLENTPGMEAFLITITFGKYHKKARKIQKDAAAQAEINQHNADVTTNNQSITSKIDRMIAGVGYKFTFNRVTVSTFKYLCPQLPQEPNLQDFEKMEGCVTNEWTDENTKDIMSEFQNFSVKEFAKDMMRLHFSPDGYIVIPDPQDPDSSNLYNKLKSWEFKLGTSVLDGILVLSFTWDSDFIMDKPKVDYIRSIAKRICVFKSKMQ